MKKIVYKDKYPFQDRSVEDLPGEIWKPIKGFEEAYLVSSFGRIKSVSRWVPHKHGQILTKDKILSFSHRKDYNKKTGDYTILLRCTLHKDNRAYYKSVSRVVYENFLGDIPAGHVILHKDYDGRNNHVANLIAAPNSLKGKRSAQSERINKDVLKYIDRTKSKEILRNRLSKKVGRYDLNGKLIKQYRSIKEATKEGYDEKSISWVCKGRWRHHKGFIWKFL